ncbi:MAG: hypothetical protein R3247_13070 [Rhodothermales bacterium]|nr:hypothetical protein [Rhodothermales bacterium]
MGAFRPHRLVPIAGDLAMYRIVLLLALFAGGCATAAAPIPHYARDELVSVRHNEATDSTLLIYRDPALGQLRHVLRRHGLFELALTFEADGGIALTERGAAARALTPEEAGRVVGRIRVLMAPPAARTNGRSTI